MVQPLIKYTYVDKPHAESLKKAIAAFYDDVSQDKFYIERKYWSNKDWGFYDGYFKKDLAPTVDEIADWLCKQYPEIKRSISAGQIIQVLRGGGIGEIGLVYRLTFESIPLLVLTKVEQGGSSGTLTFEPRNITLKSTIANQEEMESVITLFDQAVAQRVNFYKTHKSIALVEATNVVIEYPGFENGPDFEWNFGGVIFLPANGNKLKEHVKWVRKSADVGDARTGGTFKNLALIKFEGCSAIKAFTVSFDYFNYAFGLLRILGALRLNRQYWTEKGQLEIPQKSPAFISSADNTMWSGINPKMDNDFFVAVQENSIYLPIMLNAATIAAMESYEHFPAMKKLLERVREEGTYPIDEKILHALSWYSESLKNFIPLHKVVGFITALETLLTDRKLTDGISDKSISELFSERGAIILRDTYEERVAIKKKLKEIYGLRSRVVHGSDRTLGKSEEDERVALFETERIAAEIIGKIIGMIESEGIKSIPELNSYVEKKLLS